MLHTWIRQTTTMWCCRLRGCRRSKDQSPNETWSQQSGPGRAQITSGSLEPLWTCCPNICALWDLSGHRLHNKNVTFHGGSEEQRHSSTGWSLGSHMDARRAIPSVPKEEMYRVRHGSTQRPTAQWHKTATSKIRVILWRWAKANCWLEAGGRWLWH